MDSFSQSSSTNFDISKLSDNEKRELQQTLNHEVQKAALQESMCPLTMYPQPKTNSRHDKLTFVWGALAAHKLTDICFKKCISKISSGTLDRSEEACAQNCVDRWMDAHEAVLKHLNVMKR